MSFVSRADFLVILIEISKLHYFFYCTKGVVTLHRALPELSDEVPVIVV